MSGRLHVMDDQAAILARRVALAASAWFNAPADVAAYRQDCHRGNPDHRDHEHPSGYVLKGFKGHRFHHFPRLGFCLCPPTIGAA